MMVELQDISKVIMGQSPKGESYNENGKGLPLLNGAADYKGNVFKPKKFTSEPTRTAKKGDILLGVRATIGNFAFADKDYCIGRGVAAIRVDDTKADKSFILKYVENELDNIILRASGSTIKGIKKEDLTEMKLNLPPLDQQKKIAAILDAADELRQNDKALLTKYDQLTQSLFLDMFGDIIINNKKFDISKISEVCKELFLGLTSKVDYVETGGFPLVRATDINKGILDLSKAKYISDTQHKKLTSRRITKKGDVLISKSGSLGTCAIVNTDIEFSTYESIFTVRVNEKYLNNNFLIYLIRNDSFQRKLLGNQVGGTVAHLNLNMFRDFEFPLPPLSLQNQFAERVAVIEAQKALAQQRIEKSEALFNSLLQKAFNGELVK